jgi:cobalt/nickel transport system permease protein
MHIPDGFLDLKVAGIAALLSGSAVAIALRHTRRTVSDGQSALLGVTGAFVFAGQMLNFPIGAGASAHLIGGALTAALLGPSAAVLVLTALLIVQCFVFADGGVVALGANVLNMAVVHPVVASVTAACLARREASPTRRLAAIGCGAWCATMFTALIGSGQLALSKVASPMLLLSTLGIAHAVVGTAEALITVLIVGAVMRSRPELLWHSKTSRPGVSMASLALTLVTSLALTAFVAPIASSSPDVLERTAELLGFADRAKSTLAAPLPDYALPGVATTLSTSLAGLIGAALVFAASGLLAKWLLRHDVAPRQTS